MKEYLRSHGVSDEQGALFMRVLDHYTGVQTKNHEELKKLMDNASITTALTPNRIVEALIEYYRTSPPKVLSVESLIMCWGDLANHGISGKRAGELMRDSLRKIKLP